MRREEQWQDMVGRLFGGAAPRTVTFQVTDACNLQCSYCYQINKKSHVMPLETAKAFVDMLLSGSMGMAQYLSPENAGGVIIEFIGGEPLLQIDLIDQITNYFIGQMILRQHPWATRYRLSICSNGVLYFDPKWQSYLRRHKNQLSFSISIDGCKELHDACRVFPDGSGSYDIAMAGVRHYIDVMGGRMGSKMTLAPGNIAYTRKAIAGLIDAGYREINLNCVYEEGWTAQHARTLYEQLCQAADDILDEGLFGQIYLSIFEEHYFRPKKETDLQNWCGGTGKMIAVDWKGDIYPCIRYMESSLGSQREPVIIGNVRQGVMATAAQRDCVACLERIDRRSQSTDECFYCPIAEGCAWCSAYNYQHFGTVDRRATFICKMHIARALANCYYWNKGYRQTGQAKRQRLYVPQQWALEIITREEYDRLQALAQP